MKFFLHIYALLVCMFFSIKILPISIVYNLRIAQITKQPIFPKSNHDNSIIALLFDTYQKKYNGTQQNFIGGLGSYIYDFESSFIRIDTAFSHIHETANGVTTFNGTEADDILFTLGHNFQASNKSVVTISGLFGVPTHQLVRLQHVDFGYSQIGVGAQFDGSYSLSDESAVLYAARYIYFVPRNAADSVGLCYKFTLGNISDVLVAYKHNWLHHGIELGYTSRSQFGAEITPCFDDVIQKSNYLRSSFYGVYKYKFIHNNISHRLLVNFAYGFDHKSKTFGNKNIVTVWVSWNFRF